MRSRLSESVLLTTAFAGTACGSATTTATDDGSPGDGDVTPPDVPGVDADAGDGGPEGTDAPAEAEADAGPGRPVGSPCHLAEDCADGRVPAECLTMFWAFEAPNGYCTAVGCLVDDDCPGGAEVAVCAPLYGDIRACFERCTSDSDCRTSEGCFCLTVGDTGTGINACLPFCRTDEDCGGELDCDDEGRPPLCHELEGNHNGGPCAHHADCAAGSYCLAERALFGGWPKGYCTQDCRGDVECENGGVCVLSCTDDDGVTETDPCDDDTRPAEPDPSNRGICMENCDAGLPDTCSREGYTCKALGPTREAPKHVCAPDCHESAGGCGEPGWTCDPSAGVGIGGSSFGYGRCQPPLDTDALGGPCRISSGCQGGFCVAESLTGYPYGLCTEECRAFLDPCPEGFECTGGGLFAGLCFRPCNPADDVCRPGTRCEDLGWGVVTCVPDCDDNADCRNSCCQQGGTGYCDPDRDLCIM